MSYERLAEGLRPCPRGPSRLAVPARLAVGGRPRRSPRRRSRSPSTRARRSSSPTSSRCASPPVVRRLVQHRRPVRRLRKPDPYGDEPDMKHAADLGIADGERVSCRLGEAPSRWVCAQPDIPAGLTFTTFHFPDLVDINRHRQRRMDRAPVPPSSAAAIRVEKPRAMADLLRLRRDRRRRRDGCGRRSDRRSIRGRSRASA